MKLPIGLAGCSTIATELKQCCRQLGLPVRMYAARPVCLFGASNGSLAALVDRAKRESDDLLVALGQCCGDLPELQQPGAVSAARCTDLLTGSGTYGWLTEHGALPLPPPYFSIWLNSPRAREGVCEVLRSAVETGSLRSIAAIENPERACDPRGLAEIEALSGCHSRRIYVGLGHLREALRIAAEGIGLRPGLEPPAPIRPTALGPGDDCLSLSCDPAKRLKLVADLVLASLSRGLRCVWITDRSLDEIEKVVPEAAEARERGDLECVRPEAVVAETDPDDPQLLITHWITRASDALADDRSGLCLVHDDGWSGGGGPPSAYTLAYTSRLSRACAKWPILSLLTYAPLSDTDPLLQELARTHPLVWEEESVTVSRVFERTEHYLGEEDLLESLGRERVAFTCAQVQPLLSALADGELDGPSAVALAHHAQECPFCGQALQVHREIKQALAPLRRSVEGVTDELWASISRELDAESGPAT